MAVEDEDIAFAYESAATAATANQMAGSMLRWAFRRKQLRVFLAIVTAVMAALTYLGYAEDDLTLGTRLFASAFWAAGFTLIVVLVVAALVYFGNRRSFSQTARPGTVMRTGFGRDAFVTSNDLSSSRFSYRAVRSIDVQGRFVFIRYVGQPVMRVYPGDLFPRDAVERLQEAADSGH